MEWAKAMRYGGELIKAVDCDYADFKSLVPLCPNCNEPVFLRKESNRVSKLGKSFTVPRHWCHFNSISDEQKAACEARVSRYTEQERQKIQAKARGQRLKLIQRWFWRLWVYWARQSSIKSVVELSQDGLLDRMHSGIGDLLLLFSKKYAKDRVKEYVLKGIQDFANQEDDYQEVKYHKRLAHLLSIDTQLHAKISEEVCVFLFSNSSKTLLCNCLSSTILTAYAQELDKAKIENPQYSKDLFKFVDNIASRDFSLLHGPTLVVGIRILAISILTIPWASEFARLEAEAAK